MRIKMYYWRVLVNHGITAFNADGGPRSRGSIAGRIVKVQKTALTRRHGTHDSRTNERGYGVIGSIGIIVTQST